MPVTRYSFSCWQNDILRHLDAIGEEAEDGSKPKEHGKAREEALAELDPFWGGGRGGQLVQAMLADPFCHLVANQVMTSTSMSEEKENYLIVSETVGNVGSESFAELINAHLDRNSNVIKKRN